MKDIDTAAIEARADGSLLRSFVPWGEVLALATVGTAATWLAYAALDGGDLTTARTALVGP